MTQRPLIGITMSSEPDPKGKSEFGTLKLHANYAQGVIDAGGLPLMLAPQAEIDQLLGLLDGWLIPGGDDIDPSAYGQERHPQATLIDRDRYAFESALYRAAPSQLPIFGICYGCQFVNVQHGGTLHQHLPDVVGHEEHTGGSLAEYKVGPGTKLAAILGASSAPGKSYHHQAVDRLGSGLVASARHEDGTIECVEAVDRPWVVAAQWHPERTLDDESSRRLFKAFVEAAAAYRAGRCAGAMHRV